MAAEITNIKEANINELLDAFRDRVFYETKMEVFRDLVEKMNMFESLENTDLQTAWNSMKVFMKAELDRSHNKLEEITGQSIPLHIESFIEVKINE